MIRRVLKEIRYRRNQITSSQRSGKESCTLKASAHSLSKWGQIRSNHKVGKRVYLVIAIREKTYTVEYYRKNVHLNLVKECITVEI